MFGVFLLSVMHLIPKFVIYAFVWSLSEKYTYFAVPNVGISYAEGLTTFSSQTYIVRRDDCNHMQMCFGSIYFSSDFRELNMYPKMCFLINHLCHPNLMTLKPFTNAVVSYQVHPLLTIFPWFII